MSPTLSEFMVAYSRLQSLIGLILAVLWVTATPIVAQDRICLVCHLDRPAQDSGSKAPFVDTTLLSASVHRTLDCIKCHVIDPKKNHKETLARPCATCHLAEAKGFDASPHAKGKLEHIERVPTCETCHGTHNVLAPNDSAAKTHRNNAMALCISCHEDESLTSQVPALPTPARIMSFEKSVHGHAFLVEGNHTAPTCIDCHGSHDFLPSDDPHSPVYKQQISVTCGKCHRSIAHDYNQSVHGATLAQGILESPTCTNCHGEHDIRTLTDPDSKVFVTNVSKTCSDCHTADKIVAKFGLKADRIATFKESFHGAASQLGDPRVANCASCHGVHEIYPQSDPRSMINSANIQKTCGNCHENLPADFARGAVHTSASVKDSGGEFYVRQFYIWFISILILGFIVYRVLEYSRRIKRVS
jgi:hypothetical protein